MRDQVIGTVIQKGEGDVVVLLLADGRIGMHVSEETEGVIEDQAILYMTPVTALGVMDALRFALCTAAEQKGA